MGAKTRDELVSSKVLLAELGVSIVVSRGAWILARALVRESFPYLVVLGQEEEQHVVRRQRAGVGQADAVGQQQLRRLCLTARYAQRRRVRLHRVWDVSATTWCIARMVA